MGDQMSTPTLEEYLEAIYKISEKGSVRPTMIADMVGVSGPTVTATLKRLESRGLVTRERSEVLLTTEGRAMALDIIRRHRISERFLVDTLGMSWDEAHEDACRLEHALSPRVLARLEAFLENPASCPHGHPIPTAEGYMLAVDAKPLSDFAKGQALRISRIAVEEGAVLAYLGSMSMFPGELVVIIDIAPLGDTLTVEISGQSYTIGSEVARAVLVTPA